MLNIRQIIDYSANDKLVMKLKRQNMLNDIEVLKITNKSVIYKNQEKIAYDVVNAFKDRNIINIMVLSKTQSGKTGSMCATIKQYLDDINNLIPIENIYIITGHSSIEWKTQTIDRMPDSLHKRVFHRAELPTTFATEIKQKKNILIIMDEIQVAAQNNQTLFKTFQSAGLLNKQSLFERDIKILEYTATPDGTLYDLMKWDNNSSNKILATAGDRYMDSHILFTQDRVFQFKELCGYDSTTKKVSEHAISNVREIKQHIANYTSPLYHIIRTKTGEQHNITKLNFKKVFGDLDFEYLSYHGDGDIFDINETLALRPEKHTIIFIMDMLRCSKTINNIYLGLVYERFTQHPDDAVIIQGLLGRCTGYDDIGQSKVFTNIPSIIKYHQLWESEFNNTSIHWHSKTTKYKRGELSGNKTFNDPSFYQGSEDTPTSISTEPIISKFKTVHEAINFYKTDLKPIFHGTGPRGKYDINNDGFYLGKIKNLCKVWSCGEIYNQRRVGLGADSHFRLIPCYVDVDDNSTIEWWLIYKAF